MSVPFFNKYRAAMDVLQKGRDLLVEALADEILDQGSELVQGGYQFNEFLESQGTRLHFLSLLVGQLEQSAEALDEARAYAAEPPKTPARKRSARRSSNKSCRRKARPTTPERAAGIDSLSIRAFWNSANASNQKR